MKKKIKVLQVIPKLGYGGAETGCYDLAHFLPLNIVRNLVGVPDFGKENMLNWAAASFDVIGVQNQRGKRGVEEIIQLRKFITGKLNLKTVEQNLP